MKTAITEGVRISVDVSYEPSFHIPGGGPNVFSYKINIENSNPFGVKLLRRRWHIFDGSGELREVEGEGVIGQQPLIGPGEEFVYQSACDLWSNFGTMHGDYLMQRSDNLLTFLVVIPRFRMEVPYSLN